MKKIAAGCFSYKQGLLKKQLPALQLQTRTVEKTAANIAATNKGG